MADGQTTDAATIFVAAADGCVATGEAENIKSLRRRFMRMRFIVLCCLWLWSLCRSAYSVEPNRPSLFIGYNEHRTNLPGGRQANVSTNRAMLVKADGTERRSLAAELANEPGVSTQFAGWSPDGKTAVIGRGWESLENAKWEEEHQTFRFTPAGWLYDSFLVDVATGRAENVTAVERVSFYNAGLFFWFNLPFWGG